MTTARTIVPARGGELRGWTRRCRLRSVPPSRGHAAARETVTTRCRDRKSSAAIASTNGAAERYAADRGVRGGDGLCEADGEAVPNSVAAKPLEPTDQRGRQRGDHRGRSAPLSRDVSRSGRSRPARRTRARSRNAATWSASTRRTGTPSVAVISRSLASARIAVPSLVHAQEDAGGGGDREREHDRDDLRLFQVRRARTTGVVDQVVGDQAPAAPIAPNARFSTPVARYSTTSPTPESA